MSTDSENESIMGTKAHVTKIDRTEMSWDEVKTHQNECLINNVDTLLGTVDHYHNIVVEIINEYDLPTDPITLYADFQEAQYNNPETLPTMSEYAKTFSSEGYKHAYNALYMGSYQTATPFILSLASNLYGDTSPADYTSTQMHLILGLMYRHVKGDRMYMLNEANRLFFSMSTNEIKRMANTIVRSTLLCKTIGLYLDHDKLQKIIEDGPENALPDLESMGLDPKKSAVGQIFPMAESIGMDTGAFYRIATGMTGDEIEEHSSVEEMTRKNRTTTKG